MEDDTRRLAKDRQMFAGAMGAGLSHEINNVLAIIGELGGLLQDLSSAADEQGVSPAKLERVLSRINTQVERGKVFVKLLNQFSHSPEVEEQSLAAAEVVHHMIDLCGRLARLKRVTVIADDVTEANVFGDLFNLQHILFRCIEIALLTSPQETSIQVSLHWHSEELYFTLSNEQAGTDSPDIRDKFTTARQIANRLGGTLEMQLAPLDIELRLPSRLCPLVR